MPYKEGRYWRAKVVINGRAKTARCSTKKEAKAWEQQKRKELKQPTTPMGSLLDASTKYLKYCEVSFDRSTFTDKKKALKELMAATENIALDMVDSGTILNEIIMQQPTANLANKRRKDLHAFFEYCREFQGLDHNPISVINKIPQERRKQPVSTDGELAKLLLKCGDRQDKNMLLAFTNSGARRSELFRLTFSEDVDFQERQLRLGNKKNRVRIMRYRYIPMNDELYNALMDQFKHRLPQSDYVFQNRAEEHPRYGQRFTKRDKFLKDLCDKARVKVMSYHALRRYFASKLIENGENLETVRLLLGHASVSTTDIYIQRLKDDRRAAVERINKNIAKREKSNGITRS